jgi:tetratricopeptide (TPR) repeat protein
VEVVIAPSLSGDDYLAVFKRHIVKRTQIILGRVQQVGVVLPIETLKQALHILEYSLELPEAWPDTRSLLLTMAPKMEQAGYRDEWIPYLRQGIHQSQQLRDEETEAELHIQLGILFQLRGDYDVARSHLEASAKGFAALGNSHGQARALNQLAFVAQRQRQFEEAVDFVQRALQLSAEDGAEQAFGYFVLGMVALEKREWLEAVDLFQRASNLWEQKKDRRMVGRTLTLLGSALHRMNRNTEAIEIYERAIALLEQANDPVHKAMAQMNLGNAYIVLSRLKEALESHLRAEEVFRKVQDRLHLAHVNHNIGIIYRRLQQWHKAENAYRVSMRLWEQLNNVERLVNTTDGLGLVYFEQGDFTKAEATFEDALKQLSRIEGEPGYDHKFNMVMAHLKETREVIARQQEPLVNKQV